MALRFIAIDPATDGKQCPEVWLDEDTGDLILRGWAITDLAWLEQLGEIPDHEHVIRVPARMLQFMMEAVYGNRARPVRRSA